jgi:hypothetical protein
MHRDSMPPARSGSSAARANLAQIAAAHLFQCLASEAASNRPQPGWLTETGPTKNAPSRFRLRPAIRLTSAEATATRRAINLGRSVLGASRTLWASSSRVKSLAAVLAAICEIFFSHRVELRAPSHALVTLDKKRAGHEGPAARIRRAGNAFVHLPDEPSASA